MRKATTDRDFPRSLDFSHHDPSTTFDRLRSLLSPTDTSTDTGSAGGGRARRVTSSVARRWPYEFRASTAP